MPLWRTDSQHIRDVSRTSNTSSIPNTSKTTTIAPLDARAIGAKTPSPHLGDAPCLGTLPLAVGSNIQGHRSSLHLSFRRSLSQRPSSFVAGSDLESLSGESLSSASSSTVSFPVTPCGRTMTPTRIAHTEAHTHAGTLYFPPPSSASMSSSLPSFLSHKKKKQQKRSSTLLTSAQAPAILVEPPTSPPADVYRPSVPRLALEHSRASIHGASFSATLFDADPGPASPTASTSSLGTPSLSSSSPSSSTLLSVLWSYPTQLYNKGSLGRHQKNKTNGGLAPPEPLEVGELDESHLSVSYIPVNVRRERAKALAEARKAREEEQRREWDRNLAMYRVPVPALSF